MQILSMKSYLTIALIAGAALSSAACGSTTTATTAGDTAATVNGKAIKNEELEKIIKQNFQGQESKLSPLELAQGRLQALEGLIQQEVMFQKAEKEKTLPTDEEVTQKFNELRQQSGVSIDEFNRKMQEIGETEAGLREKIRRQLAIQKMGDKIAASVEPPKDTEIEAFYKGNPELFLNKRGASFAAIVIDPRGNGVTTKSPEEAQLKLKELAGKLNTPGIDFAELARQYSEDPQTAARGGDWQSLSEDQMKQLMGEQLTQAVMSEQFAVGRIVPTAIPFEGKTLILKVTNKLQKDENLTLDSPNVKQRVIDLLTNAKKQLLSAAYQARAMDEARIENLLAKRVVDAPNELSGARPFDPNATPTPAASPVAAASPTASVTASPAAANAARR